MWIDLRVGQPGASRTILRLTSDGGTRGLQGTARRANGIHRVRFVWR